MPEERLDPETKKKLIKSQENEITEYVTSSPS